MTDSKPSAPERVWLQVYGERLSVTNIDPRIVHDSGKPVYLYRLIGESADLACPAEVVQKVNDAELERASATVCW